MNLASKNKKLKVWSDALNEESLCENLTGTTFTANKAVLNERGVESYDFTNADAGKTSTQTNKNHLAIAADLVEPVKCAKSDGAGNDDKTRSVKDRLGARISYDESKPRSHIKVSELDSDERVAKEIARQLRESKPEIIERCVKVLGKKKALELLYATEDVQSKGGMPTSEGNRLRSPGGVYLQLIKKDEVILNAQRAKIFIDDVIKKKNQKKIKRLRQRQRLNEAKAKLDKLVHEKGQGTLSSIDDNENENDHEDQNEEFTEISEDKMIYFDE